MRTADTPTTDNTPRGVPVNEGLCLGGYGFHAEQA